MTTRTVYIVDDNAEFLESTRFWLSGAGCEVHAWSDPQAAVEALCTREPRSDECLLLDVRMPQLSGLGVHDALLAAGTAPPVVYMSGHADVPLAVQAMRKGAVTLLEKPFDDESLEAALAAACSSAARRQPTQPPAADAAVAAPSAAAQGAQAAFAAREARLSPRERQVLAQVIAGVYNKVIADRIGLSIKTVELYRARGMTKMQARSVAELTRMMVTRQV